MDDCCALAQAKIEMQFKIDALNAEVARLKKEKQRMEEKMTSVQKCAATQTACAWIANVCSTCCALRLLFVFW